MSKVMHMWMDHLGHLERPSLKSPCEKLIHLSPIMQVEPWTQVLDDWGTWICASPAIVWITNFVVFGTGNRMRAAGNCCESMCDWHLQTCISYCIIGLTLIWVDFWVFRCRMQWASRTQFARMNSGHGASYMKCRFRANWAMNTTCDLLWEQQRKGRN